MAKKQAIWNGQVIAEGDDVVVVERNVYFRKEDLNSSFIKPSETVTHCSWKGDANYYTLEVEGKENKDAVWYYATPKEAAERIKDRVAFWKGVEIKDV